MSPSVKEEMADFADEKDVANYEVLRAVVCYRLEGGALGWIGRQLEKLEDRLDLDASDVDSKTRNTNKIIARLREIAGDGELISFTLEEFNEAIDTRPDLKISASKHTREEYLPRVLDELEFTYHPHNDDLFVSTDEIEIPDVRDPRSKPKAMLSEADKRLAVKVDALEKLASLSDSRERYQYTKGEAVGINGLAYNNAGKYMRQVADSPGFSYNEDDDVLRVDKRRVLAAETANDGALEIIGHLAIETESETESKADRDAEPPDENGHEWLESTLVELEDVTVEEVPESALETVIQNKVARARYPDEIDETDTISGEAVKRVTDEEVETVIETLGLGDGEPDKLTDVDDQLEMLEAGRQAAVTDGGHE